MFEAQMAFNGMHPSLFSSNFMLPNEVTFNSPFFNSNPQHLEVEGVGGMVWRKDGEEHNGDDDFSDDCSAGGEKKRRLSVEQVRTLEKNFEFGNKLEPERKMQLAQALGLQPRQIAIWFQNRRARWKTKQLEKDYDNLKYRLEEAKSENLALQAENHKLQAEILALKGMEVAEAINNNAIKDNEGSCSNTSDYTSDIHNLGISRTMSSIETSLDANQSISSFFFSSNKAHELALCSKIEEEEAGAEAQAQAQAEEIMLPDESFANMLSIIDDDRDGSAFLPCV